MSATDEQIKSLVAKLQKNLKLGISLAELEGYAAKAGWLEGAIESAITTLNGMLDLPNDGSDENE